MRTSIAPLPDAPLPDAPWLRLAAALGVSLAVHAFLATAADTLPFGRQLGIFPPHPNRTPLHAVLRGTEQAPLPAEGSRNGTRPASDAPPAPSPARNEHAAPASGALAPYYYLPRELDVRPGIITNVEPQFPEIAAWRHLSGSVALRLYIGDSGKVDKVEIVRADPPGYFEAAATTAFGAARFTPGMKGGRAVRAQMLVEVAFASPPPPELPGTMR